MKSVGFPHRSSLLLAAILSSHVAHAGLIITSVIQTGGDAGVTARFTGQTYANTGGLGTVTVGLFGEDAHAYTDRGYEWNSIRNNSGVAIGMPGYLQNGEYIVPAEENRNNTAFTLTIAVSQPVHVYLFVDNRGSSGDGNVNNPPDIGTGTNQLGLPFMQWVIDSGFLPVKTGLNRTGSLLVPDEMGQDTTAAPTGLQVGPGNSIDGYESIYQKMVTTGSFQLFEQASGQNVGRDMYSVVVTPLVPEPSTLAWGLVVASGAGLFRRRVRIAPA